MDFGRIDNAAGLEYQLPADHKSLAKVLGGAPGRLQVYVGGVLWSDESFLGTIYPEKARPKDYAKHYTRQFNTIEMNLTHYRTPEEEKVRLWQSLAPTGFKFCPKVHQDISHAGNLMQAVKYHNDCGRLYNLLGDKLGPCFLQLPPHFSPRRLQELLEFLDASDSRAMTLELRHESWFDGSADEELNRLCNYLYKNRIGMILTDTPGRRDVLHMRFTNKTAFIRFNANNHPVSDRERIDTWLGRISEWMNQGLEELYFFVHSPGQLHMPVLVSYFIQRLNKMCGIKLTAPTIRQNKENETLF